MSHQAATGRRARRHLAGALVLTGCATAALVAVGRNRLASPPLLHPDALGAWAGAEGLLAATFAVLRLGAIGAGGYLCVVLGLALATSRPGARRSRRWALRLLPRRWRSLLVVAAGLSTGLAASAAPALAAAHHPAAARGAAGSPVGPAPTLAPAGPAPARPPAGPAPARPPAGAAPTSAPAGRAPTLSPAGPGRDAPPSPPAPPPAQVDPARPAPTLSPAPPIGGSVQGRSASPAGGPAPSLVPGTTQPAAVDAGAPGRGAGAGRARRAGSGARSVRPPAAGTHPTWTVTAGDSLWSIAAQVAAEHLGHPATASEMAPYWSALVAANRAHLPVPGDPDLLFVGDVVRLPAWPASP